MPSCITYASVTKDHLMFVKWTLTYLAVHIITILGRGEQDSGGERGRGRYRGSG